LALGRAYDRSDPTQALKEFGKAYQLAPDRVATAIDYGVASLQNGYTEKGIVVLRDAVALHPDSNEARFDLALGLSVTGRHSDAVKAVEMLKPMAGRKDAPALYKSAYAYAAKQAGIPVDQAMIAKATTGGG
jgi:cytochrome c-type biogenesis protein CcmH/NrfG